MSLRKFLIAGGLLVMALVWVAGLGWFVASPGAAQVPEFTDDGSLQATLTRLDKPADSFTIALSLRVQDKDGNIYRDLKNADISVTEEDKTVTPNKLVSAGRQPIRTFLVIDRSGSMRTDDKMDSAKEAALAFVKILRDDHDHVGLLFFDDKIDLALPISPVDAQVRSLVSAKVNALKPKGKTRFFQALLDSLEAMKDVKGRRILLALTDGEDTLLGKEEGEKLHKQVIDKAKELQLPLYIVGLGKEIKEDGIESMKQLADETDGRYFDNVKPDELTGLYRKIGKALQDEYEVIYDSPYPQYDGLKRTVTVTLRNGKKGTTVTGNYDVSGVIGQSATPEADSDGHFWAIFLPFVSGLAVLFAVPFVLMMVRKPTAEPAESVAPTGAPTPTAPTSGPPKPANCPQCQRRWPDRYCQFCEIRY